MGRFWVLPSVAKQKVNVYQGFRLFVILHNVCFMVCNASISGTFCTNFSLRVCIELMYFSCYWQHFLLLPSILLRTLCKHSFHLFTATHQPKAAGSCGSRQGHASMTSARCSQKSKSYILKISFQNLPCSILRQAVRPALSQCHKE